MNTDYINIISIDPGNNLGVSIFTLDAYSLKIINIETRLYVLNNLVEEDDNKTLLRILSIQNIVRDLHYRYNPIALAIETAFLNMRFPKAVIQLSQYVSTIETTFYNCNPYIKFFRYMPKYIKKNIGAGGNADKDDMTVAIKNIPNIYNLVNIYPLSEHEVDSLAIGYIAIEEIQRFPFLLYSI